MPLENLQHMAELLVAAASGFGGAWARERYRRPKVATEQPPSRREMIELTARLALVERKADQHEWEIAQTKLESKELSNTLDTLVAGMQEARETLARIEGRLEERA